MKENAFPSVINVEGIPVFDTGMSLRDYFAIRALMALDVQGLVGRPAAANLAKSAYNLADAMLVEREK